MTGGGEFYNADHLRTLGEEKSDKHRNLDNAKKYTLKGLVRDFKGTYNRLIIWSKNTGAGMSVIGTTVSGTLLSAT